MSGPQQLSDANVSEREREVLDALGEHLTNAEIAARLHISVRTVESHVSSLLRKLGVNDRRALAALAAPAALTGDPSGPVAATDPSGLTGVAPVLPSPLTPFIGRAVERAALAATLEAHRLVTAVGPGGVGKTRLALAVAGDQMDCYAAGVWYVDLVPVTDRLMIAPAVAGAIGLADASPQSAEDAIIAALAAREALLVLDNCEHLVDGVAVFLEKLLANSRRLTVLAVGRTRLKVPFEQVFPVPGLSLPSGPVRPTPVAGDGPGSVEESDAVALFLTRAAAVGSTVTDPGDLRRVAAICQALDGSALAIELAAARLPTLGLDGLEVGLGDRLRLLAGGSRLDDRHSSLRGALDWSYGLVDPLDQAVLRRLSVFAAPFTLEAAARIVGFAPVPEGDIGAVADAVGRLADQNLVVPQPGARRIRYRILETVRQYGWARLADAGEDVVTPQRHLEWCREVAADLAASDVHDADWQAAFDAVADDLRSAYNWAADRPEHRAVAHDLALALGDLTFHRGHSVEAQRRFEQAAALADGAAAVGPLERAASVAAAREAGDDALRLYRQAADVAAGAGQRSRAAHALALAATLVNRCHGTLTVLPPVVGADTLIAEARELADGDRRAEVAILVAEAFDRDETVEADDDLVRRAVAGGRGLGDPLLESAALDRLTVARLAMGDLWEAAAHTRRRIELLAPLPLRVDTGFELHDAYHMAVDTHIGLGDLRSARRFAAPLHRLPQFREGHLGSIRLVLADALAGNWNAVVREGARFRADWERQGRPAIPVLGKGAAAVAMVYGLRGEDAAAREWDEATAVLRAAMDVYPDGGGCEGWRAVFGGLVLLHRGEVEAAAEQLSMVGVEDMRHWYTLRWSHWFVALQVEAGVLSGRVDRDRLRAAAELVAGNPVAEPLVARAEAWARGDRQAMVAAARALGAADCPYQQARTLVLAGGEPAEEGARMLADLGAAPMVVPAG